MKRYSVSERNPNQSLKKCLWLTQVWKNKYILYYLNFQSIVFCYKSKITKRVGVNKSINQLF
jgi:hypothetical protein